jgi:hypothetical protein
MSFHETKLVLIAADMAGYVRATASLEALAVAALLDDWYRRSSQIVRTHGGRVVKYIGDARGSGVRISEPVYRKLPNEHRGPWTKNRPPATYSLSKSRPH